MSLSAHILDQNLVILASAGSGKTYQLGNRVIGLIGAEEIDPARMVALTFTRKAAGEFADSVLTKLAESTLDPEKAAQLHEATQRQFPIAPVLEKVIQSLPRLELGTIDSFFTRIVRGFQYELGLSNGTFTLLQGSAEKLAMNELTTELLSDLLENNHSTDSQEFIQAFSRATIGKEKQKVRTLLEEFIKTWLQEWRNSPGQPSLTFPNLPDLNSWEAQKNTLITALHESFTDDTPKAFHDLLDHALTHTIGSGHLPTKNKTYFPRLVEALAALPDGQSLSLKAGRKDYDFDALQTQQWSTLIELLAGCELAAALTRTEAIQHLIRRLDTECDTRLRKRGMLTFSDVKNLLGAWKHSDQARLQREQIDYRLDGRYDHWFLDEFQDTSPAEWDGLSPLIEEAVSDGSLFVVGDKKQAIYGWRGGDVGLFDRIIRHYEDGIEVQSMQDSYRSAAPILELVNAACSDKTILTELLGQQVADAWDWQNHHPAKKDLQGEASVEIIPDKKAEPEGMENALLARLEALQIGKKKVTCGLLVRSGTQVTHYAELLRQHGYEVIEAGNRNPTEDSIIGSLIRALSTWLADPNDSFAREMLRMSPLHAPLCESYTGEQSGQLSWDWAWSDLLAQAQENGYAHMVTTLLHPLEPTMGDYSKQRLRDLTRALGNFDTGQAATPGGSRSPRALRDYLVQLEIAQPPGQAAIEVMTIHKSKGLGFDIVLLPELSDEQVPNGRNYDLVRGQGNPAHLTQIEPWLLDKPAKWINPLYPPLQEAYTEWEQAQRYESLCLLYVALTRAKQGLYIFQHDEPKTRKGKSPAWSSHANLLRRTLSLSGDEPTPYQNGNPHWIDEKETLTPPSPAAPPQLGKAIPLRSRSAPSSHKPTQEKNYDGLRLGNEVHAHFEKIYWLEQNETPSHLKKATTLSAKITQATLKEKSIRPLFTASNFPAGTQVKTEQPFETLLNGKWISGIIDRLHLIYDKSSNLERIEIYDYKTDHVAMEMELITTYQGQMSTYKKALQKIYALPPEKISTHLISTHLKLPLEI